MVFTPFDENFTNDPDIVADEEPSIKIAPPEAVAKLPAKVKELLTILKKELPASIITPPELIESAEL
jgi:hypothetical protein